MKWYTLFNAIYMAMKFNRMAKSFRKIALAVGLQGKMTATTESPELKIQIEKWIKELENIRISKVNFETRKKQSTRLLKLTCEHCGFIARASSGAINNFGYPSHCGDEMIIE